MYFSIFVIYGYIVYSLVYIQQKESIYANLPCWYTPFLVCYIFQEWTTELMKIQGRHLYGTRMAQWRYWKNWEKLRIQCKSMNLIQNDIWVIDDGRLKKKTWPEPKKLSACSKLCLEIFAIFIHYKSKYIWCSL